MAFPPDLPAQAQDFAAKVKAALDSFFSKLAEIAGRLRSRIQRAVDQLLLRLPPGKGRIILIASLGGGAVLLLIIAGTSLMSKNKSEDSIPAAAQTLIRPGIIPPDEVFLPYEPDFIPGVLLEREQRTAWTADDAAPLWQDPLKSGEEPWRIRIEQTVEEIMESVP